MKNKKGFTLVELLAVIVVLAIIMVIAVPNVIESINETKAKTKFIAAKEIVDIAQAAYPDKLEVYSEVSVENMVGQYLEEDVTNPETGKNITNSSELSSHKVCKKSSYTAQSGYELSSEKCYKFDGYAYDIDGNCICD